MSLACGALSGCLSNEPVDDGRCTKGQLFLKPSSDTLVSMVLGGRGQQCWDAQTPSGAHTVSVWERDRGRRSGREGAGVQWRKGWRRRTLELTPRDETRVADAT